MRFLGRRIVFFNKPPALPSGLPQVELAVNDTVWAPDVFPYPRVTWSGTVIHEGKAVGSLQYGIHAQDECVYVLYIEIQPLQRRQHLGLAVLVALYQRHRLPLVPVGVLDMAVPFWRSACQRLARYGIALGIPLSRYETGAPLRITVEPLLSPQTPMARGNTAYPPAATTAHARETDQ